MYIGIPVDWDEACRLLGISCETEINVYLKQQSSALGYYGLEKNVSVLGLKYTSLTENMWAGKTAVENLADLMNLCNEWKKEVKKIRLDLSRVELARLESESEWVEYPEPMMFIA